MTSISSCSVSSNTQALPNQRPIGLVIAQRTNNAYAQTISTSNQKLATAPTRRRRSWQLKPHMHTGAPKIKLATKETKEMSYCEMLQGMLELARSNINHPSEESSDQGLLGMSSMRISFRSIQVTMDLP